mmetsp:Transcript_5615/g.14062  ORF Transcript_5615/g.14062 Transcript_5615/m.14062 type:complete len:274 (+) Transcript_5615:77-898(+)
MLLQRFGAGKATARRQGPAQSSVRCRASGQTEKDVAKVDAREEPSKGLGRAAVSAALAATLVVSGAGLHQPPTALAELNAREYDRGGEFNRGSAKQFGGVDMIKVDIVKEFGEDLRLSNFVQADIRNAKLRKANLRGAYMMKLVAPGVDFTGADMSDALMDRSIFVGANFTQAILNRVVLTASDLNDAVVEGADFSDALLDKKTQMKLCETASGTNSVTGVSTRQSLKCGGSRFSVRNSTPSRYMTDEQGSKPKIEYDADRFSMYSTKPLPEQ